MKPPRTEPDAVPKSPQSGLDFPIIGIGASAGGLAAIKTLLEGLPAAPDMAFVVVMHLSPKHESNAAAILQTSTRMPVSQVSGEVKIERNHVYVIPPTQDLTMFDGMLVTSLSDRPPGRHIVIDHFFRTLAVAHKARAFGIVLSGSGADGSVGIARLKEEGGVVIAQSPADAEHDGMPQSAIATGKVDIVLPVAEIAERLLSLWRNSKQIEIPDAAKLGIAVKDAKAPEAAEDALREIMKILLQRTGHDFKNYKRATVLRRIERRMQVNCVPDLVAYRTVLAADIGESKALLDDMLIGVTQFFRDRSAFEAVEREVLPHLFRSAAGEGGDSLRVWSVGCSTGEEAFSLAMLFAEYAGRQRQQQQEKKFTVFATDIDAAAVAAGRAGLYSDAIVTDVPAPRLHRFFSAERGGYRIQKSLRENVIFAEHNLLRDPPFSRVDLISCRNLLIYLDRAAQQSVLESFHFALRPGGHLFLGSSESVDGASRLFAPVDKAMRIYRANPVGRQRPVPVVSAEGGRSALAAAIALPEQLRGPTAAEVHRQLIEEYAPPTVLITAEYDIVHVSARASRFLRYAEGEPAHGLLPAVPEELRHELRAALARAGLSHERVDAEPVRTRHDGRAVTVRMRVLPLRHPAWPAEMLLVAFDEADEPTPTAAAPPPAGHADPAIAELEHELQRRSDQLRATVEQYSASSEELKASNEELQAINEELRSATEELETSKEELQSTNEELITVNHELKSKNDETSEINDDLRNLIASTDIATVFVDPAMRVKRFTPQAASIFNIIASDIGRSLFDLTHKLDYPRLPEDTRAVFATLRTIEREVPSSDGRRLLTRLLPYRTTDDKIGGAVLSFIDVTQLRRVETEAGIAGKRMQIVSESVADFAIITLDADGTIVSWSPGAENVFGHSEADAIGQPFAILFTDDDRAAGAPAVEMRIADAKGRAADERWMRRRDGSSFFASGVVASLVVDEVKGYAKICRDMTAAHNLQQLRDTQLEFARQGQAAASSASLLKTEFLAVMSHELKHPLNLISVNAQMLATLPEAQALPTVMRAARTIQRTVMSQGRIIDDLLDMSRLHTGKLAINRVPLLFSEAIQSALNWALGEARGRGIRFFAEGVEEPVQIDGDSVRVEQIAWNLLSNAIKFTPAGGKVTVRVSHDERHAVFEVSDTGRGISAEFMPNIFELFKQAEATTTRGEGGLGIGLALVKNLAELHGGSAEAESAGVGQGATFRVRLPLHQSSEFAALDHIGRPAAAAKPPKGLRVLLVDDTADALETFAFLLEHEGCVVTQARSGKAALAASDAAEFDLVISDVGMPGMDGYELARELRRRPRTAGLPAIALTGYGREEDVRRAFAAGFHAHVDKPIDVDHMMKVITSLLAGAPIAGKPARP